MPYFGPVTLSDVLNDLIRRPTLPQVGSELLRQLTFRRAHRSTQPAPAFPPASAGDETSRPHTQERVTAPLAGPTLKRLEGLSYVEAIVWLGSCLADGLAHAHERGILHRDLKPANILLTDEGLPMLLDFNLAEDTKLRNSPSAAIIGGTIPYMAPEQLESFRGNGGPIDGRADVFALGMILYELLTGHSPFPPPIPTGEGDETDQLVNGVLQSRESAPAPARKRNRSVSPAVWSILRCCLEADPARRYQTARQLHEDLQRQLDHQPLKHAREPSLRERFHKQLRRSPRRVASFVAVIALLLVAAAGSVALHARQEKETQEVRAELERQGKESAEALTELERQAKETETARKEKLEREQQARESLAATLRENNEVQFLLSVQGLSAFREEGVRRSRQLLERFQVVARDDWRKQPLVADLDERNRRRMQDEMGELLVLLARHVPAQETLSLLDRAEDCFFPDVPPSVWQAKAALLEQQGLREAGALLRKKALDHPLRTARDHYLEARTWLDARNYEKALPLLQKAAAIDPQSLRANFLLGNCLGNLGHELDAIGCYNVCLALDADFHGGYFNRSLILARRKRHQLALEDMNRALALRPESADAHLNRGLIHQGIGLASLREKKQPNLGRASLKKAIADFDRALELNPVLTRVYFLRSMVRNQLGDRPGADADLREGLRLEPRDHVSWNARGHAHLDRKETEAALDCFNRGVAAYPASRPNLTSKAYVLADLLHRNREALEVCERVVQLYPNYRLGYTDRGVLLARLGQRERALRDAQQALALSAGHENEPEMLYRVGCIYALTSTQEPADAGIALLKLHAALQGGFGAQHLPDDPDLKPLHKHPQFTRLRELAMSLRTPPTDGMPR
jgi:tetratricopeptide (TPR) repeat protein